MALGLRDALAYASLEGVLLINILWAHVLAVLLAHGAKPASMVTALAAHLAQSQMMHTLNAKDARAAKSVRPVKPVHSARTDISVTTAYLRACIVLTEAMGSEAAVRRVLVARNLMLVPFMALKCHGR